MLTIVITGANRGIGLEMARQFKDRGDHVVAACREASEDLATLDVEVIEGVDVTDDGSVAELAKALGDRVVDVLVNCAGILKPSRTRFLYLDHVVSGGRYRRVA